MCTGIHPIIMITFFNPSASFYRHCEAGTGFFLPHDDDADRFLSKVAVRLRSCNAPLRHRWSACAMRITQVCGSSMPVAYNWTSAW